MTNDNTLVAEIEGYASIYGVRDLNGDIVQPGAFSASLKTSPPIKMLYQHAAETPIGRWTRYREDAKGLYVYGELLLGSPKAREVHALLDGGALDGLSIGYQTARAKKTVLGREIMEAVLWEVSIVTFPMAPKARITRVGAPKPSLSTRTVSSLPQEQQRVKARTPASPQAGVRHFADALKRAAAIASV